MNQELKNIHVQLQNIIISDFFKENRLDSCLVHNEFLNECLSEIECISECPESIETLKKYLDQQNRFLKGIHSSLKDFNDLEGSTIEEAKDKPLDMEIVRRLNF